MLKTVNSKIMIDLGNILFLEIEKKEVELNESETGMIYKLIYNHSHLIKKERIVVAEFKEYATLVNFISVYSNLKIFDKYIVNNDKISIIRSSSTTKKDISEINIFFNNSVVLDFSINTQKWNLIKSSAL